MLAKNNDYLTEGYACGIAHKEPYTADLDISRVRDHLD
jgi:hypothetical protein